MKKIFTALLLVTALLMLDARVGFCQESAATSKGSLTKEPTAQQQPQTVEQQGTNTAQSPQTVKLDDKARKIKRTVQKIGVAGRITLYLKNGEELYGNVVSYGEESVQITEVDLKQVVTVQYKNIKRVREGYGAPEPFTGKRRNPSKGVKIGLTAGLFAFILLLPIIAVASSKD